MCRSVLYLCVSIQSLFSDRVSYLSSSLGQLPARALHFDAKPGRPCYFALLTKSVFTRRSLQCQLASILGSWGHQGCKQSLHQSRFEILTSPNLLPAKAAELLQTQACMIRQVPQSNSSGNRTLIPSGERFCGDASRGWCSWRGGHHRVEALFDGVCLPG